ncbi:MAG TPA: formyltetrahydrofolate deformylase, partial [Alphaproteobacteria bacterium]
LLLRHQFGDLNANILAVISNHADLRELVERFGLPFHTIPHDAVTRDEHEALLLECLGQYDIDFIVLAKYMRILSANVVAPYEGKLINIHHSFLPAFIGAKPYAQAFARGVKMIGATAHFVTNALDEGPIIVQQVVNVDHNDDAVAMSQAGREIETQTLAKALKLVFNDRVFINGNKTVVF